MKKLLLLLLAVLLAAPAGWACMCFPPKTVAEGYQGADYVISGTLIKREVRLKRKDADSLRIAALQQHRWTVLVVSDTSSESYGKYTFKVTRVYKGKISAAIIEVYSDDSSWQCGFDFEFDGKNGADYLIYGSGWKNRLYTTNCLRTQAYNQAEAQALEKLQQEAMRPKQIALKRKLSRRQAGKK